MYYLPLPCITSSSRRRGSKVIVILFLTRDVVSRSAAARLARRHVYREEHLHHQGTDTFAGGTMYTYVVV